MGLISRSLGVQNFSLEDPSQPLLPPGALFESLGIGRSDAGVMINERQALRISTAQTCIRIISEDLAATSHEILHQMPDDSFQRAKNHRLWKIIHDEPSPYMSAAIFWGAVLASALSYGNGYAWIKRDRAARVIYMVPLDSSRTAPCKIKGQLVYATTQTDTGEVLHLDPEHVLHVRGLSLDGFIGISPIQSCKNAFGLAMGAEKFGAQFFGQGARATGVLTHPGHLGPEAQENIKKSLRERISGENALQPLILEEGLQWHQITIAPNDAQFIATRQFQKEEIAQLYRVPLHLLQSLQRATNNNIEHQSLEYVRHCLRPWAVRIEEEVNLKLLDGPYVMEHNLNDLMRGDYQSQTEGIQTLRNIGVYSTDDALRKLRENPIGHALGGDVRYVQGANVPLTSLVTDGDGAEDDQAVTGNPDLSQPFNRLGNIVRAAQLLALDAVIKTIRNGGSSGFAKLAFRPVVTTIAEAMLASQYGNCMLTDSNIAAIEHQTEAIAAMARDWTRPKASQIAGMLTYMILDSFRETMSGPVTVTIAAQIEAAKEGA